MCHVSVCESNFEQMMSFSGVLGKIKCELNIDAGRSQLNHKLIRNQ